MLFRLLTALTVFVVSSVAAPALKGPAPNGIYFPLTPGAKWVYETADGALESAVVSAADQVGDDLIVTRTGVDGTHTVYAKMIVSTEGLRQERELTGGKVGWVLKAKLKPGSSWDMPEGGSRTVHGPEEITVPAGKFKALRVVWEKGGGTFTSWYAPGVGEVKRVEKRGDTETVQRTLKSFRPKEEK